MIRIKLTQGKEAFIDDEDLELIVPYVWSAANCTYGKIEKWYARTYIGRKSIYMHRFITDCPKHLVVDHIDGNGLNNQRDNLRCVTPEENTAHTRFKKRVAYEPSL